MKTLIVTLTCDVEDSMTESELIIIINDSLEYSDLLAYSLSINS